MARRQLRYVPLDEIRPAETNPKGHAPETIEASIVRFGFLERTGEPHSFVESAP